VHSVSVKALHVSRDACGFDNLRNMECDHAFDRILMRA
jgi:hypothetical protein